MAEKKLVYFQMYTSFKMIKVECSSWFLRFVSQVDSSRLSSWAMRREHSLGTTDDRVSYSPTLFSANWVELTWEWDTNLKNQLLLSTFIILKDLKILKYTDFFSNICRVLRSTVWSVLVKYLVQFWPFCYHFVSIHMIRLQKLWANLNREENPVANPTMYSVFWTELSRLLIW